MSAPVVAFDARPLLAALRDLAAIHHEAIGHSMALIDALSRGDFAAVRDAVAAQQSIVAAIDVAEGRRHDAEATLAGALCPGRETITSSELLSLLPSSQAGELRVARHELLEALVRLQALNRQATLLVRSGQAALARVLRQAAPQTSGYGPRGERAPLRLIPIDQRQPARQA